MRVEMWTIRNICIILVVVNYIFCDIIVNRNDRIYRYINDNINNANIQDNISPEDIYVRGEVFTTQPSITDYPLEVTPASMFDKSIPEKMIIGLGKLNNTEELLNLLDIKIDNGLSVSYLYDGFREESKPIPKLAKPAGCTPELHTFEVERPSLGLDMYFPWCVKLPRCSGCCSSKRLICRPSLITDVNITVIKLTYQMDTRDFKLSGTKTFTGKKHESCRCECLQKENDCNAKQVYKQEECRCVCADMRKVPECLSQNNKYWDAGLCECKCVTTKHCSTNFIFSHDTCSCIADPNGGRVG